VHLAFPQEIFDMSTKEWRTPIVVLLAGALIVNFSMGIRHGMGLYQLPMSIDVKLTREAYSFAIAIQNLVWGISSPFLGMLADKYGAARVIAVSAVIYTLGLWGMSASTTPLMLTLTGGVLIGLAQGGCTTGVITGVVGRSYAPEHRQQALAMTGALGALGQFYMTPVSQWMITGIGWQGALVTNAALMLLVIPMAIAMTEPGIVRGKDAPVKQQSAKEALFEALGHRSYLLLFIGYFVCGLQVVFIGVHLPAYLKDANMNVNVAATALALVAITNVAGTYWWGMQGRKYPKRYLLSAIYVLRAIVIVGFISVPVTPLSVYVFALLMGSLWLSTVPLTNGLVAQIYGVTWLSMLAGVVFFGHQIGSFLGAWMGGALYDRTGSYTVAWLITAGFGIFAALIHMPISEKPMERLSPAH
jgi:MFS family permease